MVARIVATISRSELHMQQSAKIQKLSLCIIYYLLLLFDKKNLCGRASNSSLLRGVDGAVAEERAVAADVVASVVL